MDGSDPQHEGRKSLVVGISGRTGSGKSTVARLLGPRGFGVSSFRDVLARVLVADGLQVNRGALRDLGASVRLERGQRWLEERVAEDVQALPSDRVVVDGVRFVEDHTFLLELYGAAYVHVHVEAQEADRRERFVARGGTVREFELASVHETERFAEEVGALADLSLKNDASLRDLQHVVEQRLVRWAKGA